MSVRSEVSMGGKKPVRIQILQPGLEKTLSSVNFSPFVYLRWTGGLQIPVSIHVFVFIFVLFTTGALSNSGTNNVHRVTFQLVQVEWRGIWNILYTV